MIQSRPPQVPFQVPTKRLSGCWQSIWAFILVLLLTGLSPFAEVHPIDPVWIAGVYNAEDLDEVVEGALSTSGLPGEDPLVALVERPIVVGNAFMAADLPFIAPAPRSSFHIRPPPHPTRSLIA